MGRPPGSLNKPKLIEVSLDKLNSKLHKDAKIPVSIKFYDGLFKADTVKAAANTVEIIEHGAS